MAEGSFPELRGPNAANNREARTRIRGTQSIVEDAFADAATRGLIEDGSVPNPTGIPKRKEGVRARETTSTPPPLPSIERRKGSRPPPIPVAAAERLDIDLEDDDAPEVEIKDEGVDYDTEEIQRLDLKGKYAKEPAIVLENTDEFIPVREEFPELANLYNEPAKDTPSAPRPIEAGPRNRAERRGAEKRAKETRPKTIHQTPTLDNIVDRFVADPEKRSLRHDALTTERTELARTIADHRSALRAERAITRAEKERRAASIAKLQQEANRLAFLDKEIALVQAHPYDELRQRIDEVEIQLAGIHRGQKDVKDHLEKQHATLRQLLSLSTRVKKEAPSRTRTPEAQPEALPDIDFDADTGQLSFREDAAKREESVSQKDEPSVILENQPSAEEVAAFKAEERETTARRHQALSQEQKIQARQRDLQGQLGNLAVAYEKKYGGDLHRAYTQKETVGESFRSWWKDVNVKKSIKNFFGAIRDSLPGKSNNLAEQLEAAGSGTGNKTWFTDEYERLQSELALTRRAPNLPSSIRASEERENVAQSKIALASSESITLAKEMTGRERVSDQDVARAERELRAQKILEDAKGTAVDSIVGFLTDRDPNTNKFVSRQRMTERLEESRNGVKELLHSKEGKKILATIPRESLEDAERGIETALLLREARAERKLPREKTEVMQAMIQILQGKIDRLIRKAYQDEDTDPTQRQAINGLLEEIRVKMHTSTIEEASNKIGRLVEAYARIPGLVIQPGARTSKDWNTSVQENLTRRLSTSILGVARLLNIDRADMLVIKGGLKSLHEKAQ